MIYYYGYPNGRNMGDQACFESFYYTVPIEYRKLITLNADEDIRLAVLGGGSLITNEKECGFTNFVRDIGDRKPHTFAWGTGYDFIPDQKEDRDISSMIPQIFSAEDCFWRGPITLTKVKNYGQIGGDPVLIDGFTNNNQIRYLKGYPKFEIALSYGDTVTDVDIGIFKIKFKGMDSSKIVLMPVCDEDKKQMKQDFPDCYCIECLPWSEYVGFIRDNVEICHFMKLHSIIAAYVANIKCFTYDYRIKCIDFEESKGKCQSGKMVRSLLSKIKRIFD